jgi:hypothetical protein
LRGRGRVICRDGSGGWAARKGNGKAQGCQADSAIFGEAKQPCARKPDSRLFTLHVVDKSDLNESVRKESQDFSEWQQDFRLGISLVMQVTSSSFRRRMTENKEKGARYDCEIHLTRRVAVQTQLRFFCVRSQWPILYLKRLSKRYLIISLFFYAARTINFCPNKKTVFTHLPDCCIFHATLLPNITYQ